MTGCESSWSYDVQAVRPELVLHALATLGRRRCIVHDGPGERRRQRLVHRAMRTSPVLDWGPRQGMYVRGGQSWLDYVVDPVEERAGDSVTRSAARPSQDGRPEHGGHQSRRAVSEVRCINQWTTAPWLWGA